MRNISFMLTTEQFQNRTKTVTRRVGWAFLKPGDFLMGCVKCQGLAKGEEIQRLGVILITDVRREPLSAITQADCIAEGFPEMSPEEFVRMFCRSMGTKPGDFVTRIEYRYVPGFALNRLGTNWRQRSLFAGSPA